MLFSYLCCCCRFCCSLSCQFCCWNFYFFKILLFSYLCCCCLCCSCVYYWCYFPFVVVVISILFDSIIINLFLFFFLHVKNYTCINTLQCWIDIYVNFLRYGIHITKLLLYIRSAFYVISNKIMQKETLMRDNTRAKS